MIRFLLPIFLLLAAFPLAAQGCYQNLQNGAGVSADPSRASTIACKLRESLPEANRASFATYSASLYRFAGNFAPGAAEALVTRLEARAAAASPYYLLIVWEASEDNLFATPHVRVNLPADGPFACLNPLRRSAWQARLLLQAQGDAPKAKDPEDYLRAETKLMEELSGYVKDLIKCCQQGQTCPDCITRKERIALLKAYPFRTIGQTSYDPAALKYRVDNVEIPGNSTAQIRDGIGISLDLGGGPVNIAEKLKELALEKPELGLNALIVHDSLLCDPELLPDRFLGGPGLRAAGSQAYVILQRDGKVDILGDEVAEVEILSKLLVNVSFLKFLNLSVEENVDPCDANKSGQTTWYMTPSGAVVRFVLPPVYNTYGVPAASDEDKFVPILSGGDNNIVEGALIGFQRGTETYLALLGVNNEFLGYINKTEGEKLNKQTGSSTQDAFSNIGKNLLYTDNVLDETHIKGQNHFTFYEGLGDPEISINHVANGAATTFKYKVPNGRPFQGPLIGASIIQRTDIECTVCAKGPGVEFYKKYYKEGISVEDARDLCLIAQLINKLGKIYAEKEKIYADWYASGGLNDTYGVLYDLLIKNGVQLSDILHELNKSVLWNKDQFAQLTTEEQILLSLSVKKDAFIKEIPPYLRKSLVNLIASGKIAGPAQLFGESFNSGTAEGTILRLFKYIRDEDVEEFFTRVSTDAVLVNKLFKGFNDFEWPIGDNNYKAFYEAFLDLYKKSENVDIEDVSEDNIFHLGDVMFPEVKLEWEYRDEGKAYSYGNLYSEINIFDWGNPDDITTAPSLFFQFVIASPKLVPIKTDGRDDAGYIYELTAPITLNLFDPVGLVISKREGDNVVSKKGIEIVPAFALRFYIDMEGRNKQIAAANFISATALAALGVGSLSGAVGIFRALTYLEIMGSAGDIAFAVDDFNNSQGWKASANESEFRQAWRLGTAVVSIPNFVKAIAAGGLALASRISNTSRESIYNTGGAVIERIRRLYDLRYVGKVITELEAQFIALGYIENAEDLARSLSSEFGIGEGKLIMSTSNFSDDYLRLYAELYGNDDAIKILKSLMHEKTLKFEAFLIDLENTAFFNLIKDNPDLIKIWEKLHPNPYQANKDLLEYLLAHQDEIEQVRISIQENSNPINFIQNLSRLAFTHTPTSGAKIYADLEPGTYLIGAFGEDLNYILVNYPKMDPLDMNFPLPAGETFNMLNVSQRVYEPYDITGGFFREVNGPWIDSGVNRGAPFIVISDMKAAYEIITTVTNGAAHTSVKLSGFGKEIHRLEWVHNYRYDPVTKRMLPPAKAKGKSLKTITKADEYNHGL